MINQSNEKIKKFLSLKIDTTYYFLWLEHSKRVNWCSHFLHQCIFLAETGQYHGNVENVKLHWIDFYGNSPHVSKHKRKLKTVALALPTVWHVKWNERLKSSINFYLTCVHKILINHNLSDNQLCNSIILICQLIPINKKKKKK